MKIKEENTLKHTLHVEGMSCEHCVLSIEGALKEIKVDAHVNLADKTVEVKYADKQQSLEKIKETIEELGYDVKEK